MGYKQYRTSVFSSQLENCVEEEPVGPHPKSAETSGILSINGSFLGPCADDDEKENAILHLALLFFNILSVLWLQFLLL